MTQPRLSSVLFASVVCLLVVMRFSKAASNARNFDPVKPKTKPALHSQNVHSSLMGQFVATLLTLDFGDRDKVSAPVDPFPRERALLDANGNSRDSELPSVIHGRAGGLRTARSAGKKLNGQKRNQKRRREENSRGGRRGDRRRRDRARKGGEPSREVELPLQNASREDALRPETMQQLVSAIAHQMQEALVGIQPPPLTKPGDRETHQLASEALGESQEKLQSRTTRATGGSFLGGPTAADLRPTSTASPTPKPSLEMQMSTDDIISPDSDGDESRRGKDLQPVNISPVELYERTEQRFVSLAARREVPYNNVVRLSLGCTGTLLSPTHVLTAAHCVHSGRSFKQNARGLRVEVPASYGFSRHRIGMIHVPPGWIKPEGGTRRVSDALRAVHDYAIVTLLAGAAGKRQFPRFGIRGRSVISSPKFAGFPSDKQYQMWETNCPLDGNSDVVLGGNLLLADCRASPGSSGSAVFVTTADDDPAASATTNRRGVRRIAGLVSNSMLVNRRGRGQSKSKTRVTVINIITKRKRLAICAMMGTDAHYPVGGTGYHAVESCADMADSESRTFTTLYVDRLYHQ